MSAEIPPVRCCGDGGRTGPNFRWENRPVRNGSQAPRLKLGVSAGDFRRKVCASPHFLFDRGAQMLRSNRESLQCNQLMMAQLEVHSGTFGRRFEYLSTDARSVWEFFHTI